MHFFFVSLYRHFTGWPADEAQAILDGRLGVCVHGHLHLYVSHQQHKAVARGGFPEGLVSFLLFNVLCVLWIYAIEWGMYLLNMFLCIC